MSDKRDLPPNVRNTLSSTTAKNIIFIAGVVLGVFVTGMSYVLPGYLPRPHELLGFCLFIQAALFVIDYVAKDIPERAVSVFGAISIGNLSFALYQVGAIFISFISQRTSS